MTYDRLLRRLYLRRRRVHHGAVGAVLIFVGAVLVHHDRRDWPWRFSVELERR